MYKPLFNKRRVLVFHQFGNKGWSLFSCLGREVVCSVLSVSTLTYASAESISTKPVVTDTVAVSTAREMQLEEVSVTGSRAPLTKKSGSENGHCIGACRYSAGPRTKY
jgi:iron complex outermembrane receptor protein